MESECHVVDANGRNQYEEKNTALVNEVKRLPTSSCKAYMEITRSMLPLFIGKSPLPLFGAVLMVVLNDFIMQNYHKMSLDYYPFPVIMVNYHILYFPRTVINNLFP